MAEDAEILQGLYGLRLEAPGLSELFIAVGLGLALVALAVALAGVFRRNMRLVPVADRVAATRALPLAERLTALAVLLRELTDRTAPGQDPWTLRAETLGVAPGLLRDIGTGLYRPDPGLDAGVLEQAVLGAARRAGV
ncbi:MAG: hypothetical protein AAFN27_17705 [Pseudomonadota bacterium]